MVKYGKCGKYDEYGKHARARESGRRAPHVVEEAEEDACGVDEDSHLLGRRAEETVLLSSTTGRPQERCACRKGRRGMEEAAMVVSAMATEAMAKCQP